jgi:hypothetical protein
MGPGRGTFSDDFSGNPIETESLLISNSNFRGIAKTPSSMKYYCQEICVAPPTPAMLHKMTLNLNYGFRLRPSLRLAGSLRKMSILLLLADRFFPPARGCCSLPEGI